MEIHDLDIVAKLQKTAHEDWENSHEIGLSDEGLMAELKDRGEESEEKERVLHDEEKDKKHHHKK
jgi:hypothetical protein